MPINISTDIAITTGGKLTDITAIQGGWQTVATVADMNAYTGSATLKGKLTDGQIFYVNATEELYQLVLAGSFPFNTYTFESFSWPGGGGGSSDYSTLSNIPSGIVSQSNSIVDIPGTKLQYSNVYSTLGDLPSASSYHGMFAHVHATGKAYFAHGGNWVELANAGSDGDITSVVAGSGLSGGATTGDATLNLDTGSSHFINAINGLASSGIFSQTGSYYSTNNNIQITGSLQLKYDGNDKAFSISSGSSELISVNSQGVLLFASQSVTPTEVDGGMYRDINGNFFLGM
jgi:hypothetical protein